MTGAEKDKNISITDLHVHEYLHLQHVDMQIVEFNRWGVIFDSRWLLRSLETTNKWEGNISIMQLQILDFVKFSVITVSLGGNELNLV